MRSADISQLPVVDHGKLVGILDESDVLSAVAKAHDAEGFATKVGGAMTRNVKTLESHQPMSALTAVFERDEVAVVMDGDELLGLITRVDLINHLRRTA
jgi:cystathionine beta-synthase